jgi:hypothetical protein
VGGSIALFIGIGQLSTRPVTCGWIYSAVHWYMAVEYSSCHLWVDL